MPLFPGTKLGAYEIRSPLGAGGMGEVYRATDTKLGRDVALKVLPGEVAQDGKRLARFRREAMVLAQLDDPNIVTIYSVEEFDGVHFLTMQLVDGLPLASLIPQGGLPLEQIVESAKALADALAAAHEKGIVHRDLKPANVMVTPQRRIKVLDFGLAKDVRGFAQDDLTKTLDDRTSYGVVMGTPAYMSPEQASGRPLDHRTDIFSLGVLLHEMSTGKAPFEGGSPAELVSAILRDTPPSVTDLRPELPPDLARIIHRCLEKDLRMRFQSAREVSAEILELARGVVNRAPAKTPSGASAASNVGLSPAAIGYDEGFWVAVLPCKYTGNNSDLKALADGLFEDIITGLSRFSYLRVIARGSTVTYWSESGDVRGVGKELGARYVMEASLRQAGSKLRLTVQLVDSVSGAHLWAENFERGFSPDHIFELQDDLVPRIVSTVADMNGVLPRSMSQLLRSRKPEQLTPYEAVLRSFGYYERITSEELIAARSGLEAALQKAPTHADAWALLALLCLHDYAQGFNLVSDPLAKGAAAAEHAIEAGPSSHLGYFGRAQASFFQREFERFRNAAERALALNPMDGNCVASLGLMFLYAGDEERGLELTKRAKQLNPNHPGWYWFPDFYHAYVKGDYRGALGFALKINLPRHYASHMMLLAAYGQLGDRQAAESTLRTLLEMRPGFANTVRSIVAKWWQPNPRERLMEGLRKGGLKVPEE